MLGVSTGLDKMTLYINALYQKSGFDREKYVETTELKRFGALVDEDVSRMLQILVRLTQAKRILEIGTSIGYSTLSMAKGMKDHGGKIVTIEIDRQVARQARKNFARAGFAENIEVKIGDALEIIPQIQEEFDLIFQDVGDKRLYSILLDHCVRLLKPCGLLLAEDSLLSSAKMSANNHDRIDGHNIIPEIQRFNEMVANCPSLESTILPIGDGLTVAVKIG